MTTALKKTETVCIKATTLESYTCSVPLDHSTPEGPQIEIFVRIVSQKGKEGLKQPYLVKLQGGPGYECSRPRSQGGWIGTALSKGMKVVLLDQRGTGLSTPITNRTILRHKTAEAQAEYLSHFRAPAIVADCEIIRKQLGVDKWSLLGQSYGGFCCITYLSQAPSSLAAVYMTGGLAPLSEDPDDVYTRLYKRVLWYNERFNEAYPNDAAKVRSIVDYLQANKVTLPGGGTLTVRRFQALGLGFGFGFESMHYLLEHAFDEGPDGKELGLKFLRTVENRTHYTTNPLYAVLHESIYCQGKASNWSAERVRKQYPQFSVTKDAPVYFTGEMIYPWYFDDFEELQPFKEAANIIASKSDWPKLYDKEVLKTNTVPVAAIAYFKDMYVDFDLSMETAEAIQNCRIWVTNGYLHNGLGVAGAKILTRLMGLQNDVLSKV